MKICLVVLSAGKMQGKEIPITVADFKIGRDASCQLKPAAPGIAEKHCAVLVKAGKVFLKDFGSSEGTVLNNTKVNGELEIKNGDQFKVGPLHFEVKLEAPAKPAPSPSPEKPKVEKPASESAEGSDEPDLDDLLFDDGEKKEGTKPSWKDNIGKEPAQETSGNAGANTASGEAKPEEKPKPTGTTSDAAAALLAKFRPPKK
ncbi:MAG: hypothetical protein RL595_2365 [Planctomycetota bacterium]|jgi:pSer/pThr/pTyr-binding forkhead associated (FHA) protein